MTTCIYVTSLDAECGREATVGEHCDFHSVLAQLDALADPRLGTPDEMVIAVPASQRPLIDRILSDVAANFDVTPHQRREQITREMGTLIGMGRNPDVTRWMRWDQNPTVHIYPGRYDQ